MFLFVERSPEAPTMLGSCIKTHEDTQTRCLHAVPDVFERSRTRGKTSKLPDLFFVLDAHARLLLSNALLVPVLVPLMLVLVLALLMLPLMPVASSTSPRATVFFFFLRESAIETFKNRSSPESGFMHGGHRVAAHGKAGSGDPLARFALFGENANQERRQ